MDIEYKTKKLCRICSDIGAAKQEHGPEMAALIHQRIGEICASDNVETMVKHSIGRCHPLKGDKKNLYALDLIHPYRLIISKAKGKICVARVECIKDYH